MPSPQDVVINSGEGHGSYNTKPLRRARGSNPFIPPLNEIEPNAIESEVLESFVKAVAKVGNVNELSKIVDQAIDAGVRINAYRDGHQRFANSVVSKILSGRFEGDKQKDIICKLLLNGAFLDHNLVQGISEVYNKLYREVQPQIDKGLKVLKEVGENAAQGGIVEDVGIDNKTFYMKLSKDSTVEPEKVLEGARKLGLNAGWAELGGHIMRMGDNAIEIKVEKGGKRDYVGFSNGTNLIMTLHSDLGELKIRLRHDKENNDLVQVIVEDKEMWNKLQEAGGIIKDNCLLGGKTIEKAIKEGGFERSGMFSKEQAKEKIKAVNSTSETLSSWADKTRGGSKETSRGL